MLERAFPLRRGRSRERIESRKIEECLWSPLSEPEEEVPADIVAKSRFKTRLEEMQQRSKDARVSDDARSGQKGKTKGKDKGKDKEEDEEKDKEVKESLNSLRDLIAQEIKNL